MVVCEECGCLVDPELTEVHEDWHNKLVVVNKSVANPKRTQINEPREMFPGMWVQNCNKEE